MPVRYVPAGQFKHVPNELAALEVEYFPAAHVVHTVEPPDDEKVPTGHALQGWGRAQWLSFPKHCRRDEFPNMLQAVWMSARYCVAFNMYSLPRQAP